MLILTDIKVILNTLNLTKYSNEINYNVISILGKITPPAPELYTSCHDKQDTEYQTLQSAWDDCVKDSSCKGVYDNDCDNDKLRLCYGLPKASSSDTCLYRNLGNKNKELTI